jgi:hypothetical protein
MAAVHPGALATGALQKEEEALSRKLLECVEKFKGLSRKLLEYVEF